MLFLSVALKSAIQHIYKHTVYSYGQIFLVPLQLIESMFHSARLEFAIMHIDRPQSFREKVLWTEETKLGVFWQVAPAVCSQMNKRSFHRKNIVPTVKHGGCSVRY